jgi:hypothetical protein
MRPAARGFASRVTCHDGRWYVACNRLDKPFRGASDAELQTIRSVSCEALACAHSPTRFAAGSARHARRAAGRRSSAAAWRSAAIDRPAPLSGDAGCTGFWRATASGARRMVARRAHRPARGPRCLGPMGALGGLDLPRRIRGKAGGRRCGRFRCAWQHSRRCNIGPPCAAWLMIGLFMYDLQTRAHIYRQFHAAIPRL